MVEQLIRTAQESAMAAVEHGERITPTVQIAKAGIDLSSKFILGIKPSPATKDIISDFQNAKQFYQKGDIKKGNEYLERAFKGMDSLQKKSQEGSEQKANTSAIAYTDNYISIAKKMKQSVTNEAAIALLDRTIKDAEGQKEKIKKDGLGKNADSFDQHARAWSIAIAAISKSVEVEGFAQQTQQSSRFSGILSTVERRKKEDYFKQVAIDFRLIADHTLDYAQGKYENLLEVRPAKETTLAMQKDIEQRIAKAFSRLAYGFSRDEKILSSGFGGLNLEEICKLQSQYLIAVSKGEKISDSSAEKIENANKTFSRCTSIFFSIEDDKTRDDLYKGSFGTFGFFLAARNAKTNMQREDNASLYRTTSHDLDLRIDRETKANEAYTSLKSAVQTTASLVFPLYGLSLAAHGLAEQYDTTGQVSKVDAGLFLAGLLSPALGKAAQAGLRGAKAAETIVGVGSLGVGTYVGIKGAYEAWQSGKGVDAIVGALATLQPLGHPARAAFKAATSEGAKGVYRKVGEVAKERLSKLVADERGSATLGAVFDQRDAARTMETTKPEVAKRAGEILKRYEEFKAGRGKFEGDVVELTRIRSEEKAKGNKLSTEDLALKMAKRELEIKKPNPLEVRKTPYDAESFASSKEELGVQRRGIMEVEERVRKIITQNRSAFEPKESIQIGQTTVHAGSPMKMGNDTMIPVYITEKGKTSMVTAYASESQGCWRRYAGSVVEHYYKGESEHFQTFDYRIQKLLDKVSVEHEPVKITYEGRNVSMRLFGEIGTVIVEEHLQKSLEKVTIDFKEPGIQPGKIIDHWISPSSEDVYGKHITLVVESENGKYLYMVAATKDGMFVKSIQDKTTGEITKFGITKKGILPKEDWVLTPLLEYRGQEKEVADANLTKFGASGTIAGIRSNRIRITGLHESTGSPFYALDQKIRSVYDLVATQRFEDAQKLLIGEKVALPIKEEVEIAKIDKRIKILKERLSYNEKLLEENKYDGYLLKGCKRAIEEITHEKTALEVKRNALVIELKERPERVKQTHSMIAKDYSDMPMEFAHLRLDLERGQQKVVLTKPLNTEGGSNGAIFLAELEIGDRKKEVAVKIYKNPTSSFMKNSEQHISDIYSKYKEPSDIAFSGEERVLLDEVKAKISEGMEEKQAILEVAKIREWGFKAALFERETKNAEILSEMGVGLGYHGIVDIGDGNISFAMDIVHAIDGYDITAKDLSEIASKNGLSRTEQAQQIISQLEKIANTLASGSYIMEDFQYAILKEDQVINGRQRKAGDIIVWDGDSLEASNDFSHIEKFWEDRLDREVGKFNILLRNQ